MITNGAGRSFLTISNTWMPLPPGIEMSSNITSGLSRRVALIASKAISAWPTISTEGKSDSSVASRSRTTGESSTMKTFFRRLRFMQTAYDTGPETGIGSRLILLSEVAFRASRALSYSPAQARAAIAARATRVCGWTFRPADSKGRGGNLRPLPGIRPVPLIHVGEEVVPRLNLGEPGSVHLFLGELFVQGQETEQVVLHPSAGVIRAGAGAQDERPIAGLSEQQFARGLFERAAGEAGGVGETARQFRHPLLGDVQVRIDPLVGFVEPDFPIAFLAPARSRRRGDLVRRVGAQIIPRRRQPDGLLVENRFADKVVQEFRPLLPPVAEQLGVVGRKQMGWTIQDAGEVSHLPRASLEEMAGVFRRGPQPGRPVVNPFFPFAAGNRVIFEAGKAPRAGHGQVRFYVVVVEVEPDVAVKIAVARVARIPFLFAPDLPRRIEIPAERRQAVLGEEGREHPVARPRVRVQNPVGIDDEPPNA